ncbi:glycerate kinase [Planococcus citri]|uniref:glycerate kinase n=1 Tax=Planococcus citri TaxID=170843 RepID=UPI0031F8FEE2
MKAELKTIFKKCLQSVNPSNLIRSSVSVQSSELLILNRRFKLNKNCYIVGFGKAVYEMAIEMETLIGDHLCEGVISIPVGMRNKFSSQLKENSVIKVFEGGKDNLPDEDSFKAASCIRNLAEKLKLGDLMIVLVSGGGSALLPYPLPPITIEEKINTIKMIANAGADIVELNTVRKELSALKGGKLARLAYPSTTVALILSDIVGDPIDFIACGPTVLSRDFSNDSATNILEKYDLCDAVPASIQRVIFGKTCEDQGKLETDEVMKQVHNVIIGNNSVALEAAKKEAEFLTYSAVIISNQVSGLVSEVADIYGEIILNICKFMFHDSQNDFINNLKAILNPRKDNLYLTDLVNKIVKNIEIIDTLRSTKTLCLIAGGEPTVKVTGKGLGGRNQELVLLMGLKLFELKNKYDFINKFEISFLSAGTDGIDGPTDAAGATCHLNLLEEANLIGLDPNRYLEDNDSYNFFSLLDNGSYSIKVGHTGTNVMDIHMISLRRISPE